MDGALSSWSLGEFGLGGVIVFVREIAAAGLPEVRPTTLLLLSRRRQCGLGGGFSCLLIYLCLISHPCLAINIGKELAG